MATINKQPYGDSDRNAAAGAGPLGETNYLQGTDINPTETKTAGSGLVNQHKTKNCRSFNRPNKGSVTVRTTGTPKW